MAVRRAVQQRLHSENVAPGAVAAESRGAKRVRVDENAGAQPAAKKAAVAGLLKVHAENIIINENGTTGQIRKPLRLKQNSSNGGCAAVLVAANKGGLGVRDLNKDDVKQPLSPVAEEGASTETSAPGSSASKPVINTRRKLTNVMVALEDATPLDFYVEKADLPEGIADIDRKVIGDAACEAHYAHGSFAYLREREAKFICEPYIQRQTDVSPSYRSLLVDWMVEVQESFELNHETLYLAVKIVDMFLSKSEIRKAEIQLLGATAMLISSKIDERIPPSLGEFTYICDDAYKSDAFIAMERRVLEVLDFELSMPLSYSFLRRFCRSLDMDMRDMTLARFILECSLMEYSLVSVRESQLAAGALLLALDILGKDWNDTLAYYTGYRVEEILPIRNQLNRLIHHLKEAFDEGRTSTRTIVQKYSHEVFYKVANVDFPPIE